MSYIRPEDRTRLSDIASSDVIYKAERAGVISRGESNRRLALMQLHDAGIKIPLNFPAHQVKSILKKWKQKKYKGRGRIPSATGFGPDTWHNDSIDQLEKGFKYDIWEKGERQLTKIEFLERLELVPDNHPIKARYIQTGEAPYILAAPTEVERQRGLVAAPKERVRPEIISPTDPAAGDYYADRMGQYIKGLESQPYVDVTEGKPITKYGGTQRPSLAPKIIKQHGRSRPTPAGKKPRGKGLLGLLALPFLAEGEAEEGVALAMAGAMDVDIGRLPRKDELKRGIAEALYDGDTKKVTKSDIKHFEGIWQKYVGYPTEHIRTSIEPFSIAELTHPAEIRALEEAQAILAIRGHQAEGQISRARAAVSHTTTAGQKQTQKIVDDFRTDLIRVEAAKRRMEADLATAETPAARRSAQDGIDTADKRILDLKENIRVAKAERWMKKPERGAVNLEVLLDMVTGGAWRLWDAAKKTQLFSTLQNLIQLQVPEGMTAADVEGEVWDIMKQIEIDVAEEAGRMTDEVREALDKKYNKMKERPTLAEVLKRSKAPRTAFKPGHYPTRGAAGMIMTGGKPFNYDNYIRDLMMKWRTYTGPEGEIKADPYQPARKYERGMIDDILGEKFAERAPLTDAEVRAEQRAQRERIAAGRDPDPRMPRQAPHLVTEASQAADRRIQQYVIDNDRVALQEAMAADRTGEISKALQRHLYQAELRADAGEPLFEDPRLNDPEYMAERNRIIDARHQVIRDAVAAAERKGVIEGGQEIADLYERYPESRAQIDSLVQKEGFKEMAEGRRMPPKFAEPQGPRAKARAVKLGAKAKPIPVGSRLAAAENALGKAFIPIIFIDVLDQVVSAASDGEIGHAGDISWKDFTANMGRLGLDLPTMGLTHMMRAAQEADKMATGEVKKRGWDFKGVKTYDDYLKRKALYEAFTVADPTKHISAMWDPAGEGTPYLTDLLTFGVMRETETDIPTVETFDASTGTKIETPEAQEWVSSGKKTPKTTATFDLMNFPFWKQQFDKLLSGTWGDLPTDIYSPTPTTTQEQVEADTAAAQRMARPQRYETGKKQRIERPSKPKPIDIPDPFTATTDVFKYLGLWAEPEEELTELAIPEYLQGQLGGPFVDQPHGKPLPPKILVPKKAAAAMGMIEEEESDLERYQRLSEEVLN